MLLIEDGLAIQSLNAFSYVKTPPLEIELCALYQYKKNSPRRLARPIFQCCSGKAQSPEIRILFKTLRHI